MSWIAPNEGCTALMGVALGGDLPFHRTTLYYYGNDYSPVRTSTIGDFAIIDPDGGGLPFNWFEIDQSDWFTDFDETITSPEFRLVVRYPTTIIYGYLLVGAPRNVMGPVLLASRFATPLTAPTPLWYYWSFTFTLTINQE